MYKDENINKYRMSINILVALMGMFYYLDCKCSLSFTNLGLLTGNRFGKRNSYPGGHFTKLETKSTCTCSKK